MLFSAGFIEPNQHPSGFKTKVKNANSTRESILPSFTRERTPSKAKETGNSNSELVSVGWPESPMQSQQGGKGVGARKEREKGLLGQHPRPHVYCSSLLAPVLVTTTQPAGPCV